MPLSSQTLWTDEKIEQTVNEPFIRSQLRTNEETVLKQKVFFGGELTDDTYLEWILSRARRLFLILVAVKVPEQIFGLVDESYDDEDLPVLENAVSTLRLSLEPNSELDRRFYKAQFKFLTRIVGEGEHIRYSPDESVPITVLGNKAVVNTGPKDRLERVRLPFPANKVFVRQRYRPDERTESEVMSEIAAAKVFAHDHILTVFGSYSHRQITSVLSTPASDMTLRLFLNDTPKPFDALPKPKRRYMLVTWTHCLASALAWLHRSRSHGAIRPSRIHVDEDFNVYLGFLEGDGVLCNLSVQDDLEAYQYGAPEKWKRAVMLKSTGSGKITLPSGGRRARKSSQSEQTNASNNGHTMSSHVALSADTSMSYAFIPTSKNASRLRLGVSNTATVPVELPDSRMNRHSERPSTSSRSTIKPVRDSASSTHVPSLVSSSSSGSTRHLRSALANSMFVAGPETRAAAVQTWQSVEEDSDAADIFSLTAVIMDVLTILCKRSYSSFAKHRSAKNRNAGRGGGIADASFHANPGQVMSWAQLLRKDAEKKARNVDGLVFNAVGPMLQILLQAQEKEPHRRPSSSELTKEISHSLSRYAKFDQLHCKPIGNSARLPALVKSSQIRVAHGDRGTELLPETMSSPAALATLENPLADMNLARTGTHDTGEMPDFEFDFSASSMPTTQSRHKQSAGKSTYTEDWDESEYVEEYTQPDTIRDNVSQAADQAEIDESIVDPRLSRISDRGAFTFMDCGEDTSSDEDVKPITFPRTPSSPPPPPPSSAPLRDLPALPSGNMTRTVRASSRSASRPDETRLGQGVHQSRHEPIESKDNSDIAGR